MSPTLPNTDYIGMWNSTGFFWQPEEASGVNLTCCSCFCLFHVRSAWGWGVTLRHLNVIWNRYTCYGALREPTMPTCISFFTKPCALSSLWSSGPTANCVRGLTKLPKYCMEKVFDVLNFNHALSLSGILIHFDLTVSDLNCLCSQILDDRRHLDILFQNFNIYNICLVLASCSLSIVSQTLSSKF
jgi:hypothetical protein